MDAKDKKNIKIAGGVAAAILIIYLVTKSPSGSNGGSSVDPTGNGTLPDASSPTVSFNAIKIADGLEKAMKGPGTDEAKIQSLLRTVTQAQFKQVYDAFGQRDYGYIWTDLQPLEVWLDSELSSEEYETLRLKYPQYL